MSPMCCHHFWHTSVCAIASEFGAAAGASRDTRVSRRNGERAAGRRGPRTRVRRTRLTPLLFVCEFGVSEQLVRRFHEKYGVGAHPVLFQDPLELRPDGVVPCRVLRHLPFVDGHDERFSQRHVTVCFAWSGRAFLRDSSCAYRRGEHPRVVMHGASYVLADWVGPGGGRRSSHGAEQQDAADDEPFPPGIAAPRREEGRSPAPATFGRRDARALPPRGGGRGRRRPRG